MRRGEKGGRKVGEEWEEGGGRVGEEWKEGEGRGKGSKRREGVKEEGEGVGRWTGGLMLRDGGEEGGISRWMSGFMGGKGWREGWMG